MKFITFCDTDICQKLIKYFFIRGRLRKFAIIYFEVFMDQIIIEILGLKGEE